MEKNDMKKITKQWLFSKGFQKCTEKAYSGIGYFYPQSDFDIIFLFDKNRFNENYFIDVGFRLHDETQSWGTVRTNMPLGNYGFYYEQWEKQDYIACLEEIYELYIQPYFDLGVAMLKKIVKKPSFRGQDYLIHRNAFEKIRKM
ncbi:MAG: hypothetical protein FWE85_06295 [Clostridiales bacterium]|nr:hypothetical protein [Clostridiales bacterium]